MFGQFHGLPVHALVLHAAVVLTPFAAVVGIVFLVPRFRPAVRRPLAGVTAAAAVTLFVAKESGEVLRKALGTQVTGADNPTTALVARHAQLGDRLLIATVVLLGLALLVAAVPRATTGAPGTAAASCIAVVAVVVLILTYQTGEAGAKARWNPDGSFDYSGT